MALVPGGDFGSYRIIERAGTGGMATVYKAYQPALARHVAIKVLPGYLENDGDFPQRFQREAVAVASLRHPNIPGVFDYGTLDEVTYIVSEYIDGGTLSDQLGRPLPPAYVVEILRPVASAIDYAHSRSVLHRDIKPTNIMLARDGRPVLNDFGLAQMMNTHEALTVAGTVMGTPQYMAPEQCAGDAVGPAADIYALSIVAYEMLTGRVPFRAATPAATLIAQMQEALPLPRSINPELSEEIESVLLKGLAKNPADRFGTASALVQALAVATTAVGAAPTTRVPASAEAITPDTVRRSRTPAYVAAAVVVLGLVVGGGYYASRNVGLKSAGGPGASATATVNALPINVVGTPIPSQTDIPLSKGPLVWAATFADGSAFSTPSVSPAGGASAKFVAGALQVNILHPDGRIDLVSKMPPMAAYIGEIDLVISRGSHLTVNWGVRPGDGKTNGDHVMNIDTTRTSFALKYLPPPGSSDPIIDVGDRFTAPEITNGSPFTMTVGTGEDAYVYFFNNRGVDTNNDDHNTAAAQMNLSIFGHDGSVRVTGLRVYNVP
jgi:serine/threonine protein kinase